MRLALLCSLCLILSACSSGAKERIRQVHTVLIEAVETAHTAIVSGCDGLPTLQVALSLVEPYLKPGSTMTMIKDNESVAVEFCEKIKAAQAAKG